MTARGPFVWLCSSFLVVAGATGCSHTSPPAAEHPVAVVTDAPARPAPKPPALLASDSSTRTTGRDGAAIYFDFDSALLRDESRGVLAKLANNLRSDGSAPGLEIDGNCDELGTVEYNLALGQQRAEAAKRYLVQMGIDPTHIRTASYGSQRPRYPGHDELAHARNRRDDLVYR